MPPIAHLHHLSCPPRGHQYQCVPHSLVSTPHRRALPLLHSHRDKTTPHALLSSPHDMRGRVTSVRLGVWSSTPLPEVASAATDNGDAYGGDDDGGDDNDANTVGG
ncbi:unnamed protein product [Hydatigera taeniaeformis]|uniref:Uncharacterized protein n=1 Tax=Hydatigena taeniaeformis TaxID=6205 RepID=A0A0R3WYA8_HYDTA|nr:unnamed protein product [Hydatigera taeniaeformis]